MVTIILPPELEQAITARALQQGTTPELLVIDELRQRFTSVAETSSLTPGEPTMADFLKDFIGVIDSSKTIPGGAQMSIDCGKEFAEGMAEKRRKGKL